MPMMIAFDAVTYSPGSVVSGHVVIVRSTTQQKVKGLSLRISGRANRLHSEIENPIKNHKKEVYFDERLDIFGHDGQDSTLPLGETLFPFTFTLPPGLPSSFIWNRGNILYFVEARLTRSGWKDDKKVSVRLDVEGIYDLNLDPIAPLKGSSSASKYVNHLLNKSGPFGYTFDITRSGWVRGHTLPFQVKIKNLSKVDAKRVKVGLVQEISQDGKVCSSTLQEIKGPSVPSGEIQSWEGRLKLPGDIPPTNLGNLLHFSPVLGLNYFIQIELSPKSATADSLITKVPIIIGTIPLSRSRSRSSLLNIQVQHDEGCPLNATPPPVTPSQFSPGFLNNSGTGPNPHHHPPLCRQLLHFPQAHLHHHHHHPHNQPHNHPHNNYGIYRRLRNLQSRRRRESPPPSYSEVVGDSNPPPSIITTTTPSPPSPSPPPESPPLIHKTETTLTNMNASTTTPTTTPELCCPLNKDEVTVTTTTTSTKPSTSHDQGGNNRSATPTPNRHHIITVKIGGDVDDDEDNHVHLV